MSGRSDNNILISRYAAAWRLAATDARAPLANEAMELQASFANDPRLARLLDDRTIPRRAMAIALHGAAKKSGLSNITAQFLAVLAQAGRQSLLPKILGAVQRQIDDAAGIQNARLTSAAPLNGAAVTEIQTLLSKQLDRDVRMTTEVDENLLGGMQIELNSWLIDASLTGQLARLERQLKSTKAA
jgi:F-type H+-transporting ATPase subunit delta